MRLALATAVSVATCHLQVLLAASPVGQVMTCDTHMPTSMSRQGARRVDWYLNPTERSAIRLPLERCSGAITSPSEGLSVTTRQDRLLTMWKSMRLGR